MNKMKIIEIRYWTDHFRLKWFYFSRLFFVQRTKKKKGKRSSIHVIYTAIERLHIQIGRELASLCVKSEKTVCMHIKVSLRFNKSFLNNIFLFLSLFIFLVLFLFVFVLYFLSFDAVILLASAIFKVWSSRSSFRCNT